jgi:hypothetical protein
MKQTKSQISFKKAVWVAICSTSNKEHACRILFDMYRATPCGNLATKLAAMKFLKTATYANGKWAVADDDSEERYDASQLARAIQEPM